MKFKNIMNGVLMLLLVVTLVFQPAQSETTEIRIESNVVFDGDLPANFTEHVWTGHEITYNNGSMLVNQSDNQAFAYIQLDGLRLPEISVNVTGLTFGDDGSALTRAYRVPTIGFFIDPSNYVYVELSVGYQDLPDRGNYYQGWVVGYFNGISKNARLPTIDWTTNPNPADRLSYTMRLDLSTFGELYYYYTLNGLAEVEPTLEFNRNPVFPNEYNGDGFVRIGNYAANWLGNTLGSSGLDGEASYTMSELSISYLPPLVEVPPVTPTETVTVTNTETATVTGNTTTETETEFIGFPVVETEYINTTTETVDQLVVTETDYGNFTEWNASANNVHVNDGEINGSLPVPYAGWMYGFVFVALMPIIRRRKQ